MVGVYMIVCVYAIRLIDRFISEMEIGILGLIIVSFSPLHPKRVVRSRGF